MIPRTVLTDSFFFLVDSPKWDINIFDEAEEKSAKHNVITKI